MQAHTHRETLLNSQRVLLNLLHAAKDQTCTIPSCYCSIRTTTTVTLSADPRCTALLASRLQAASYLASTADLASLEGTVLSCKREKATWKCYIYFTH